MIFVGWGSGLVVVEEALDSMVKFEIDVGASLDFPQESQQDSARIGLPKCGLLPTNHSAPKPMFRPLFSKTVWGLQEARDSFSMVHNPFARIFGDLLARVIHMCCAP